MFGNCLISQNNRGCLHVPVMAVLTEYLDLPDGQIQRPSSTRCSVGVYTTSAGPVVDHTRSTQQDPSRQHQDHLPTHISTSTRPQLDFPDPFPTSSRSTRPAGPFLDFDPTSTRPILHHVLSGTIAADLVYNVVFSSVFS